jgi:hypothetical protein
MSTGRQVAGGDGVLAVQPEVTLLARHSPALMGHVGAQGVSEREPDAANDQNDRKVVLHSGTIMPRSCRRYENARMQALAAGSTHGPRSTAGRQVRIAYRCLSSSLG